MKFEDYLLSFSGKKLSKVKVLILKTLWGSNDQFPSEWVPSSTLLELTGQKYFDRRTRELRDELGCDIETKHINGEHHYRLVSTNKNTANPRSYLSERDKATLFARDKLTCQVCGCQIEPGVRGLQADHKVPLIRGGTHDLDNWQSLCNECNVAKRRACQGCEVDCQTCGWAFPDQTGVPLVVRLPKDIFDQVSKNLGEDSDWLVRKIEEAITQKDRSLF